MIISLPIKKYLLSSMMNLQSLSFLASPLVQVDDGMVIPVSDPGSLLPLLFSSLVLTTFTLLLKSCVKGLSRRILIWRVGFSRLGRRLYYLVITSVVILVLQTSLSVILGKALPELRLRLVIPFRLHPLNYKIRLLLSLFKRFNKWCLLLFFLRLTRLPH